MASSLVPHSAPVQQPDLSAFIVCDRLPEGCTAYVVPDDKQAPLLRAGEWVVVDPTDREPAEGELFVIQWQSGARTPQVVECGVMPQRSDRDDARLWAVGARHRGANAAALGFGKPGQITGDFPYRGEQLFERFLGRVVGILEVATAEPLLLAA